MCRYLSLVSLVLVLEVRYLVPVGATEAETDECLLCGETYRVVFVSDFG